MKELLQNLGDVLRAKKDSDEAIINRGFLAKVENTPTTFKSLNLVEDTSKPIADYLHSDLKRRAQTIGKAYQIAIKYFIAVWANRQDLVRKLNDNLAYFSNKEFLDERYKDNDTLIATHIQSLVLASELEEIDLKTKSSKIIINAIANFSVIFAWVETYYSTGFFPQDLSIIDYFSEVHKRLVEEVILLLHNSNSLIDYINEKGSADTIDLEKPLSSTSYGIIGSFPITVNGTAIGVKTTGKYPTPATLKRDVNYLKGLYVLDNNILDPYDGSGIQNYAVFYPRFNQIIEVDFSE